MTAENLSTEQANAIITKTLAESILGAPLMGKALAAAGELLTDDALRALAATDPVAAQKEILRRLAAKEANAA